MHALEKMKFFLCQKEVNNLKGEFLQHILVFVFQHLANVECIFQNKLRSSMSM
jgi:hypothetical protein